MQNRVPRKTRGVKIKDTWLRGNGERTQIVHTPCEQINTPYRLAGDVGEVEV